MGRSEIQKKWYMRWWGSVILFLGAGVLIFFFALLYEYVTIIQNQRTAQLYQSLKQFGVYNPISTTEQQIYTSHTLTEDDPVLGNQDASVVIIEFGDFQCPFCKRVAPVVKEIARDYADTVAIQFRDFPIEQAHPEAVNASLAAECAHEQGGFWEYHDRLYDTQNVFSQSHYFDIARELGLNMDMFSRCYDSQKYKNEILQDFEEGRALGVTGTPTFFINGSKLSGVLSYDQFVQIIEGLSTKK